MTKKTKQPAERMTTLFLEKIPVQTKVDFKAACIHQQTTMRQVFLDLMDKFVCESGTKRR